MESNELRIGNFLYDRNGKKAKVEVINKDGYECYSGMVTPLPLSPIPLSMKWLKDLGFNNNRGRHGVFYFHKTQELFRVWESNEEKSEWGVGRKDTNSVDREYNTHWIVLNLKYVHQLQNLFFMVTGEELHIAEE